MISNNHGVFAKQLRNLFVPCNAIMSRRLAAQQSCEKLYMYIETSSSDKPNLTSISSFCGLVFKFITKIIKTWKTKIAPLSVVDAIFLLPFELFAAVGGTCSRTNGLVFVSFPCVLFVIRSLHGVRCHSIQEQFRLRR